jgi:hypothetical protein
MRSFHCGRWADRSSLNGGCDRTQKYPSCYRWQVDADLGDAGSSVARTCAVAGDMSAQDAAFVTLALAVGACGFGVEIMDRLAARSFPKSARRRFGPLTLWVVAAILAAAALLRSWLLVERSPGCRRAKRCLKFARAVKLSGECLLRRGCPRHGTFGRVSLR